MDGLVGPIYHRWIPFDIPGLGIATTAVLILAGRRRRDQRLRQAAAAARRGVPDDGARVPHDLLAGEADRGRLLAGQRMRLQEGGARRGSPPRAGAGVPDEGVLGWTSGTGRSRWWRSTCRPTTSTSATWSSCRGRRVLSRTSRVEEGVRIILTGGMAAAARRSAREPSRRAGYRALRQVVITSGDERGSCHAV
ncbi:MAG: hypothetical protein M0C28_13240 [Candidatus Moduliflexus flocculans]|nr:hypothetical protein [Candidatus Moduliflexus flocculans]